MTRSLGLVVRNVVFTVVVPGLGGVWLPWWLLTHGHGIPAPAAWEAVPVIAAGAALYFWCAWNFATVGGGTPGPWDAPRRVVAHGPYRWVRNPIYLAALLVVLGEAWLFTSPRLLAYAAAMAACFHLFVTGYEERTLARRFGPAYLEYRRAVPRWLPRKPRSPQKRAPQPRAPNHGHLNPRGENTMTTIRRASLAVLAILVLEYGIGVYVSLYATVPRTDHGAGIATAIARGPAALSTHAVLGLLLGLGAIAVLVQAIRTRHPAVIATSALGLFAIAVAAATGASFTSTGEAADSMGMAVMTGVALLCYAANLYLLPRPASPAKASPAKASPA